MVFHDSMEHKQGCGCQKQTSLGKYPPSPKPHGSLRLPDFTLRAGLPGPASHHKKMVSFGSSPHPVTKESEGLHPGG